MQARLTGKKFYENNHFTDNHRRFLVYLMCSGSANPGNESYYFYSQQGDNNTHAGGHRETNCNRNGNSNKRAQPDPAKLSGTSNPPGRRRIPGYGQDHFFMEPGEGRSI